mmetsp:Transcript_1421/g.1953  ORF Transcript_1421/g.1953 Transcript_1421/m.1953 type:complete len:529 (-) Transcript_1421:305-1891(-)
MKRIGAGHIETPVVEKLTSLGKWCSEHKLLDEDAVVKFLEDILDYQTVEGCERALPFIEKNLQLVIKSSLFRRRTKLGLLRICNMLLKRLSKTTNTAFCGQILMLLAKSLPLDERSGVNLLGTFNSSNLTPIQDPPDIDVAKEDKNMEVDSGAVLNSADEVDHEFYKSLWQLQKYFAEPNKLSEKEKFDEFVEILGKVLTLFEGSKVEHVAESAADGDNFYPKYLTGIRLLNLQLEDSVFRRTLLTQAYLLFSFLEMGSSSKKVARMQPIIDTAGKSKCRILKKKVEQLLEKTPANGEHFAKRLKNIVQREDFWSKWKDFNCKPLENKEGSADLSKPLRLSLKENEKKKERGKFLFRRNNSKRLLMGDPILYRLWTLNDDILAECSDEEHNYVPKLKGWLSIALKDEANPDIGFKKSRRHNKIYTFRALRLMACTDLNNFNNARGTLDPPTGDKKSLGVDLGYLVTGEKTVTTEAANGSDEKDSSVGTSKVKGSKEASSETRARSKIRVKRDESIVDKDQRPKKKSRT